MISLRKQCLEAWEKAANEEKACRRAAWEAQQQQQPTVSTPRARREATWASVSPAGGGDDMTVTDLTDSVPLM